MTAAFCLFVFVDELLEFIEFGCSDILKRDPECVLSDPLHARVFNRDRFLRAGNDQSQANHLAGVDFEVTIEPGATDREVESDSFDLMRVSQQKSLNLCWHPAMFSSIHVARKIPVSRAIRGNAEELDLPPSANEFRYRSLRSLPSSTVSVTNFSKFLLYSSLSNSWASSGSNQKT